MTFSSQTQSSAFAIASDTGTVMVQVQYTDTTQLSLRQCRPGSRGLARKMRDDIYAAMTPEEEIELSCAWQKRKDPKARDRMVLSVYRMLYGAAQRASRSGYAQAEDLLQEAMIGAMRACDTYEPDKGRFTTYAMWWARSCINRRLANDRTLLSGSMLRSGVEFEEANKRRRRIRVLWLDAMNPESDSAHDAELRTVQNMLQEVRSDDADIDRESKLREVRMLVEDLSPRERWLIEERYLKCRGDQRTLESLAEECGLSRERIRQIEEKTLKKLRKQARGLFDS